MDSNRDLRSDKTIIVGFTGPIGSGCTNISRFLANFDEFSKLLVDLKFINHKEDTTLNVNILDDEIRTKFNKKSELEKEINQLKIKIEREYNTDAIYELEIKEVWAKIVYKELKDLLEQRRYIYSLEYLIREDFYKTKLRISCSSILVFELLRKVDDPIILNDSANVEKRKKVSRFKELFK